MWYVEPVPVKPAVARTPPGVDVDPGRVSQERLDQIVEAARSDPRVRDSGLQLIAPGRGPIA